MQAIGIDAESHVKLGGKSIHLVGLLILLHI